MPRSNAFGKVKRSATGFGFFAVADIPKGTRIARYTGELIANTDTAKYKGRYLFKIDEEYTIDGSDRANLARYINHSCRPNAYPEIIEREIWIIAKRKIKAFEEITYHYGKEYFNFFIKPRGCCCVKCRHSLPKTMK
jgi:SET domain-containing protein